MWIGIISLFPEMFKILKKYGIVAKAYKKKLIKIKTWNIRDFTNTKNKKVDSKPYGGGDGMLIMADPLIKAIKQASIEFKKAKIIYLSPKGKKINQFDIKKLFQHKKIILLCGRYQGIDERVINYIDEEYSIGDYILSGGEIPSMVLIDAITRLIPGVLSKKSSIKNNSFFNNLLDCPYYTKPEVLYGKKVPSVLLSGHHKKIKKWKLKQSLGITWLKRPDLIYKKLLNKEKIYLLTEFLYEFYSKIRK